MTTNEGCFWTKKGLAKLLEVWKYQGTPSTQPRQSEDTVLENRSSAPLWHPLLAPVESWWPLVAPLGTPHIGLPRRSGDPFVVPTSSSCGELVAFGHSPSHPLTFLPCSLLARVNIEVKEIPFYAISLRLRPRDIPRKSPTIPPPDGVIIPMVNFHVVPAMTLVQGRPGRLPG